jgi:ribulose-phosphate 3-epimerase
MAAADEPARPLPVRELPASLRARLGLPAVWGALDDRAHVLDGDHALRPLRLLDAAAHMTQIRVAPSILSADFARLGDQVRTVMDAGARVIHVDVMDGHFVPPITLGPLIVGALRDALPDDAYLDCHLMIERPERQIDEFVRAGADGITIHAEATPHLHRVLTQIREGDCRAGLACNPGTPIATHQTLHGHYDLALIMTVNPGWGGQSFIPQTLDKVRALREQLGPEAIIEVDGGVDVETARTCVQAGATWLVAGSAIFGSDDPVSSYNQIATSVEWG